MWKLSHEVESTNAHSEMFSPLFIIAETHGNVRERKHDHLSADFSMFAKILNRFNGRKLYYF